ncbi:MAG TPA: hypothetical protein V6D19_09535 [Stenomitos sp.]
MNSIFDSTQQRGMEMTANASLEERLAAVEAAIAQLQQQMVISQQINWLQQITGSFKDELAFDEVLAYGRAIRQGDESLLEAQDER